MKKIFLLLSVFVCVACLSLSASGCHTHEYTSVITAPTCTEQGYTTYTCECGDTYKDDYVNELGHDFTNYTSDNNATYDSDGTKTATCDRNGCEEKDTITDTGSMLESKITFNSLQVDGTTVTGKVSNDTEIFSFLNEVEVIGNASYSVYKEITCETIINSKTITLEVGNNAVYILESIGNDIKLYIVTVYRRAMFQVSFNTYGGTSVQSQSVEEDSLIAVPTETIEKAGYTFDGWDFDFNTPITKQTTINANLTPRNDTQYKVEYYFENIDDDGYSIDEDLTKELTGTTDTTATVTPESFEYYIVNEDISETCGNIQGDGKTVLKIYYEKIRYLVKFETNGGTVVDGNLNQYVKHGGSAVAPTLKRTGYNFIGWDIDFSEITQETVVIAKWGSITGIVITYNSMGGSNCESYILYKNDTTYVLPTPIKGAPQTGNDYHFLGWWYKEDNATEPNIEIKTIDDIWAIGQTHITLYAKWNTNWIDPY